MSSRAAVSYQCALAVQFFVGEVSRKTPDPRSVGGCFLNSVPRQENAGVESSPFSQVNFHDTGVTHD